MRFWPCDFPGCKGKAAAPVTFANGETNWFCASCLTWLRTEIPANQPDKTAPDDGRKLEQDENGA